MDGVRKAWFDPIDTDGNGSLDKDEIKTLLLQMRGVKTLGVLLTPAAANEVSDRLKPAENDTVEQFVTEVIDHMDVDGDGRIQFDELKHAIFKARGQDEEWFRTQFDKEISTDEEAAAFLQAFNHQLKDSIVKGIMSGP